MIPVDWHDRLDPAAMTAIYADLGRGLLRAIRADRQLIDRLPADPAEAVAS